MFYVKCLLYFLYQTSVQPCPVFISAKTRFHWSQFHWRYLTSHDAQNVSPPRLNLLDFYHFVNWCDTSSEPSAETPRWRTTRSLYQLPPPVRCLTAPPKQITAVQPQNTHWSTTHTYTHTPHTHTTHASPSVFLTGGPVFFSEVMEDQCWLHGVIIWGIRLAYLRADWVVSLAAVGRGD